MSEASDNQTVTDTSTGHNPVGSLRILRVSTDVYPEVLGGGAIHAHEMSSLQADLGHDVTVLTSDHGDRSLPRTEHRDGYAIRRFREVANPLGNSVTPRLFRTLRRLRGEYDIVHTHSHLYLSTNVAATLAYFDETPLVITNHGLFSQSAPSWFNNLYLHTLGRFTLNAADRILCYTETDEKRLRNFGVSTPVSLIHNGVDCEQFAPVEETVTPPEILFVGRLMETKGVRKLIEAFATLETDARLRIVGEGPLREELEERVRTLDLENEIAFTGRIPNDELPNVYAKSAVFALPSSREGLPRTLLEALACGTPVVTSDLSQLEPVVDGCGLTVQLDSTENLATAIDTMLADDARRQSMGERGRQRVETEYSWENTVQKTIETYRELLNETTDQD